MARGGSSSSKKGGENADSMERVRLKRAALENNILSDAPAKFFTPLSPSNQVIKHHGKDILKKSQRKNRFLFSFPGLLAPLSGGKIGELNNLGTKNPVLYIDFPQGRMKLFGTIVYPKNRYLTLQFSRGGKNVMCEDYFDNMVVFSDVWWIGRKDENPEEAQLDFPKELTERQPVDYDFKGGAGMVSERVPKIATKCTEQQSPEANKEDRDDNVQVTPVRQSKRNAQKKFKFVEVSSGDEFVGTDADVLKTEEGKASVKAGTSSGNDTVGKFSYSCPDFDGNETSKEKSNTLVQATISTLFKKADEKVSRNSEKSSSRACRQKLQDDNLKREINEGKESKKKQKVNVEKTGRRG